MKNKKFIAVAASIAVISAMNITAFAAEEPASEEEWNVATEGTSIVNDATEDVEASDTSDEWNGGDTVDYDTGVDEADYPSFQYIDDGVHQLYEAEKWMPNLNATAGGTGAFLLQLDTRVLKEKNGYSISFLFTSKDGKEYGTALTGEGIPDYGIEPDGALTGYAGGYAKEDIAVLPVNIRWLLEAAGISAVDVADLKVVALNSEVAYIAFGTYEDAPADTAKSDNKSSVLDTTKTSPKTGVADVAVIAAGIAIIAGGACVVAGKKKD